MEDNEYIIESSVDTITYDSLIEEINRGVPDNVQAMLRKPSVRRQMLERCGKGAFLIPGQLKFPIVRPDKSACDPCCSLLYAAYVRARQWKGKKSGYGKIAEKAKKLFEKSKCSMKIGVKIEEVSSDILDIDVVLEMLDGGLHDSNTKTVVDFAKQAASL